MSGFLHSDYQKLEVYTPGEQPRGQTFIKLNTNESPYPPSPGVSAAVGAEAARLQLYSDPDCLALRKSLATRYGVLPENVFVSNGSDDILNFAFMAFCTEKRQAAFADVTYGFYSVFAALHRVEAEVIPLRDDFTLDFRDYCGKNKLIVIANPNAPTGCALPLGELEEIIRSNPKNVVVIDEAYVDFGAQSACTLVGRYPNLLVVQTFSKSRSMAGARLGFAIADAGLIADLNRIKFSTNPYNVNRMTLAAGEAALAEDIYYAENCKKIMKTRAALTDGLSDMGFTVLPSLANFVFAKSERIGGGELYRRLRAHGILVRHFDAPRIADYNRITVGTDAQCAVLLRAVQEILKEENNENS